MKKIVFLFVVMMAFAASSFAQQANEKQCYDAYVAQQRLGYNALAMAIDNGFFVCGFAFGSYSKEGATRQALNECEGNRVAPANEVMGVRKIMTHCRIYEFKRIE